MDVPKAIFFLLISLIPMSDSVESGVPEAQKGKSVTDYQRKLIYNSVADGVKGPKEEMREKITLIKGILDEVSALAEICGACDSNPCLNGGTCIDEANGKYSCACAIGWKGDQCEKCHTALGMESGKIKDDQITSSTQEAEHQASRGRLNFEVSPGKPGSWCSRVKDDDQWLQVDLGNGNRKVSGIATQGGTNYREKARWVEKYRLAFSDDGVNFHYYKGGEATDKEFVGNKDRDTIVYNELSQPITSRYIRIRPIAKGKKNNLFAMRVELYGCQDIDDCSLENDCHVDAICNNTKGSYNCTCKDGFEGDGRNNCVDIDECSTKNECHHNALCKNTKGSYICTCQDGFEGDGKYCTADPECQSYIVNKETDRSVTFINNDSSHPKCDRPLAAGWYRFNGRAGSKMPTTCTQDRACNTHASGWINGINPSPQEGIVTRTVCFSWGKCCNWKTSIKVRNCGLFYVYYLTETPACNYRYCVTN